MVPKQQKVHFIQRKRHVPGSIHHSAASREEMCPKYHQPQTIFTLNACTLLPISTLQKQCTTETVNLLVEHVVHEYSISKWPSWWCAISWGWGSCHCRRFEDSAHTFNTKSGTV